MIIKLRGKILCDLNISKTTISFIKGVVQGAPDTTVIYPVDCRIWGRFVVGFFIPQSGMFTYEYNRSVRKCPLVVIIGRFRSKLIQGLTCTSLPGEVVPSVNLNKKPFHTRRYYYLCCTTIFDFKMHCNAYTVLET